MVISNVDLKLLKALEEAGGEMPSKFKLINEAEVNYRSATARINYLQKKGFIQIKVDRPGCAHQVTLIRRKLPEETK
jgi:hypothetical protein